LTRAEAALTLTFFPQIGLDAAQRRHFASCVGETMSETDAAAAAKVEADLIRQGERTIDNLKRLFAVVFALSFGVVATGAIENCVRC
jgi:hypothetical protein